MKKFLLSVLMSFFLAHTGIAMKRSHEDDEPPISFIPNDVFVKIFYQLNLADWQTASIVCKKWHQLINSDSFWQPLIGPKFGNLKKYLLTANRATKEVYFNDQYSSDILSINTWSITKIEKLLSQPYQLSRKKLLHNLEHALIKKAKDLNIDSANKLAAFLLSYQALHADEISKNFEKYSIMIAQKTCRYAGHVVRRKACNIPSCRNQQVLDQINQKIAAAMDSDDGNANEYLLKLCKVLLPHERDNAFINTCHEAQDSIHNTMTKILNQLFCDNPLNYDLFSIIIAKINYLYGLSAVTDEILYKKRFDQNFNFILKNSNLHYRSPHEVIEIFAEDKAALKNAYIISLKNVMDFLCKPVK